MRGLPDWKYATDAQINYLTRLQNEAFSKRVSLDYVLNFNVRRYLKAEVSDAIGMARRCLGKD